MRWSTGLLSEIYTALQNDARRLAAMGVRSLIEHIMIAKVGDQGSFVRNLEKFETDGYVSPRQREQVEAILEAGHATTHRNFKPSRYDLITLVDIAESIVQTVYVHEDQVAALRKRVPPREKK
jgi:DNA-binding PadR family transcriptional regulator